LRDYQKHGRSILISQSPNLSISQSLNPLISYLARWRPGRSDPYVVKIESPSGAPAGSHAFRLDMVGVANPDEEYSQGPTITFTTPPPAETGPAFPWWIPVAAVVILLIAVVAIWRPWERETVIPPAEVQIPDFAAAGLRVGDAEATVTGIPASRRAGRSPRSRPEWLR
jgi:hypothetical protein